VGPASAAERGGARAAARHGKARRGVILSLVGTVASSYVELLGLDEQLVVAKKTQGAYKESLRLFELQFKHGQVSEMAVAQARSQYETATAQIPESSGRCARLENAMSILVGRNPGPIAAARRSRRSPGRPFRRGCRPSSWSARPDILQAEQQLIAAERPHRGGEGLYLPSISLTGALGSTSSQLSNLFQRPGTNVELRRLVDRADLHCRRDQRAGGPGRGDAKRQPRTTTGRSSRVHSPTCRTP